MTAIPVPIYSAGTAHERRQRILQMLKDAGHPMTVKEVLALMPAERSGWEWTCPNPERHNEAVECIHAKQTFVWTPGYSNVYADLKLMERDRKVQRRYVGSTLVWESYDADDDEAEAIRSILESAR